jgi:ADP-ribosylglycohydrolase
VNLPDDYLARVYAGVLGKVIGVYLGRPFEGWSHDRIMAELGEITSYVHEAVGAPLIVTDDDITGTLTFIRALEDYGYSPDISAAQIGHTWLNYLIENETVLWWGGLGNSTEHTAYLRLKDGIEAPASGSIALNGRVVAEQIGAQIFIDGWGAVAPGDPTLAASLARRAASVSHDGVAVDGAAVVAAMIAAAFVEPDVDAIIDAGLSVIPERSLIATMIGDVRAWHAERPDWHDARARLDERYGYARYGGNCHIVPNHGLIVLALLYGEGRFGKSMTIVNTAGWDTDCNAGNLGFLLGVRGGLDGLDDGGDWRGPVADRLYLPTADGGRSISDALTEGVHLANLGRRFHGLDAVEPKGGARFHFDLPGAVQGFTIASEPDGDQPGAVIENVAGHSLRGERSLAVHLRPAPDTSPVRVTTPTFIPSRETAAYFDQPGYRLLASPTLHPGQVIRVRIVADATNASPVHVAPCIAHYDADDSLRHLSGDQQLLAPGASAELVWEVPDTDAQPVASAGVALVGDHDCSTSVYLDELTWTGSPTTHLGRPIAIAATEHRRSRSSMWRRAWVDGLDGMPRLADRDGWPEPYRLIQNRGRGLLMQGGRAWTDYTASARMTPHLCRAGGIAVRVQGMERYYSLLLDAERTCLVLRYEGRDEVLADAPTGWTWGQSYDVALTAVGNRLVGQVDGVVVIDTVDPSHRFTGGAMALVAEEGRIGCDDVVVTAVAWRQPSPVATPAASGDSAAPMGLAVRSDGPLRFGP